MSDNSVRVIPTGVTKDGPKLPPARTDLGLVKRMGADCMEYIFDFVMRMEGGDKYTNIPGDHGGPTKYGVTQRVYDAYRVKHGKAQQTVKFISKAEALDVFKTGYWNEVKANDLPACTALALVDFAYNSGPGRALRYLRALTHDPLEYAKMNGDQKLANMLTRDREHFLRNLVALNSDQAKFLKGWMNRIDAVEKACAEINSP